MSTLQTEEGLELFDRIVDRGEAAMLPVALDLPVLRSHARTGVLPSILSGLVPIPRPRSGERAGSFARRLAEVPEGDREDVVLELVRGQVASVLGHVTSQAIDAERAFKDLGFDSLAAVELRNRLNAQTGLRLPATLVFDYPTTTAITNYLMGELIQGNGRNVDLDPEEAGIREVFASIPMARIRQAGLMEVLFELAGVEDERATSTEGEKDDLIETMDIESLAQMTLENADSDV
jgi:polyketide synthase 12